MYPLTGWGSPCHQMRWPTSHLVVWVYWNTANSSRQWEACITGCPIWRHGLPRRLSVCPHPEPLKINRIWLCLILWVLPDLIMCDCMFDTDLPAETRKDPRGFLLALHSTKGCSPSCKSLNFLCLHDTVLKQNRTWHGQLNTLGYWGGGEVMVSLFGPCCVGETQRWQWSCQWRQMRTLTFHLFWCSGVTSGVASPHVKISSQRFLTRGPTIKMFLMRTPFWLDILTQNASSVFLTWAPLPPLEVFSVESCECNSNWIFDITRRNFFFPTGSWVKNPTLVHVKLHASNVHSVPSQVKKYTQRWVLDARNAVRLCVIINKYY